MRLKKAICTITKGDSGDNCDDPASCNSDSKELAPIGLKGSNDVLFIPGVVAEKEGQLPFTLSKAFKFTETKVYKVKMKVEQQNGTKYEYVIILDYKDDSMSHVVGFNDLDGDSSSDLFGIPTSSHSFMPELRCAALSRANVFAIK